MNSWNAGNFTRLIHRPPKPHASFSRRKGNNEVTDEKLQYVTNLLSITMTKVNEMFSQSFSLIANYIAEPMKYKRL